MQNEGSISKDFKWFSLKTKTHDSSRPPEQVQSPRINDPSPLQNDSVDPVR